MIGTSRPERPRFVAGSVGPTTKLVSLGHIPLDEQQRGNLANARLHRRKSDQIAIELSQ